MHMPHSRSGSQELRVVEPFVSSRPHPARSPPLLAARSRREPPWAHFLARSGGHRVHRHLHVGWQEKQENINPLSDPAVRRLHKDCVELGIGENENSPSGRHERQVVNLEEARCDLPCLMDSPRW